MQRLDQTSFWSIEKLSWVLASLMLISILFFTPKIKEQNLLFTTLRSYQNYKSEITRYDLLSSSNQQDYFKNVKYSGDTSSQIHILIIGESTSRHHMSLYGYYRQTNPALEKISGELALFQDVISPNAHTIESLTKSFDTGKQRSTRKPRTRKFTESL